MKSIEVQQSIINFMSANNLDFTHITHLRTEGKIIHIATRRPGILIGRRGEVINELLNRLRLKFGFSVTVNIITDTLWSGCSIPRNLHHFIAEHEMAEYYPSINF